MINKQRIEEAAAHYEERELFTPSPHRQDSFSESFVVGVNWVAQEIMSKASEGFEEWFLHYPSWDTAMSRQNSCEVAWKASRLSSEKEIQQLKQMLEVAVEALNSISFMSSNEGRIAGEALAKLITEDKHPSNNTK